MKKTATKKDYSTWMIPLGIVIFYLITHLWNLTKLPVFADEAIYIRWAQLIIDDPKQYAFFPLNDGKTPLFIWSLIPLQFVFQDQLLAGRVLSVLVGVAQLFVVQKIIRELGGQKLAQYLGMILVTILPFWFFYHRMALMDGMLTLFLSLTVLGSIKLGQGELVEAKEKNVGVTKLISRSYAWVLFTGISFGLALWSKLPALFLLPALPLFLLTSEKTDLSSSTGRKDAVYKVIALGSAVFIGLGIFVLLKAHPAFGQLFGRSRDFTYPVSEVLMEGKWRETIISFPNYMYYFVVYLTLPVMLLSIAGVFSNAVRKQNVVLLLAFIIFVAPFALLGKVVFARYLLPASLFITVAATLSIQAVHERFFVEEKNNEKSLAVKGVMGVLTALLLGNIATSSAYFMLPAVFAPSRTPFLSSDQVQYLTEWSSGYGIPETVEYIRKQSASHKIAVATEGSFGTLPDALLMYFHRKNVENLYIEGTAQYPVKSIPEFFIKRAKDFDQSILVVNSHRMELSLPPEKRLFEVCRPYNAPCLQVWDITDQVKTATTSASPASAPAAKPTRP